MYQFSFDASGGLAQGCIDSDHRCLSVPNTTKLGAPAWYVPVVFDFPVTLLLTDAFQNADLFEILNNGEPVEAAPPLTGFSLQASVCDPLDLYSCLNDPSYNSLVATFAPGTPISLELVVTQRDEPIAGSAFFLLTGSPQAVPEPSTWMLLAGGLFAAALHRRRATRPRC